ncbi:hypothetical protein [Devosia nitrariae]|nr:hypothetical protein [Devosia nitrariae]
MRRDVRPGSPDRKDRRSLRLVTIFDIVAALIERWRDWEAV